MAEEILNFTFLGVPQPKQSFRYAVKHDKIGNNFVSKYQSDKVKGNAKDILVQVIEQLPRGFKPWTGGIMFRAQFVFPPPSSFSKKKLEEMRGGKRFFKTTKPDIDNIIKACTDPMQGRVFINDSQICNLFAEKVYGEVPKTVVSLKHLGQ